MKLAACCFLEPQVPHHYRWQVNNPHLFHAMQQPSPSSTNYFLDARNATTSAEPRVIGVHNPAPSSASAYSAGIFIQVQPAQIYPIESDRVTAMRLVLPRRLPKYPDFTSERMGRVRVISWFGERQLITSILTLLLPRPPPKSRITRLLSEW